MIKLENICKKLDKFELKNINLEIQDNEYFVILGQTGSGKTVLLNLIAGMLEADSGNMFVGQLKSQSLANNFRRDFKVDNKIGILYQDYMLFPHYTVRENIAYSLKFLKTKKDEKANENANENRKKSEKEKVDDICEKFDISHIIHRYPRNLSGGEKQRTAFARALISKPEIILLDEPFASLDIVTKNKLIAEVKQIHKNEAISFVHVTHDFEEAITLADRMCVIDKGEILQIGTPEEIFKKPETEFVANFVDARNIFSGEIQNYGDLQFLGINLGINNVKILFSTEKTGFANITIRPEDILLSTKKIESSARNSFSGKITDVLFKQYICEVKVDIGFEIVAFITKRSYDELELGIGKHVWTTFKVSEVHVF